MTYTHYLNIPLELKTRYNSDTSLLYVGVFLLLLGFFFFLFFCCSCGIGKFSGPEIEPAPQKQPMLLQ